MAKHQLDPIPPGEILLEDFIRPLGLSINALARAIDVPPNRVSEIVNGKRAITADTALRLESISEYRRSSGSIFNSIMICAWRASMHGRRSSPASARG